MKNEKILLENIEDVKKMIWEDRKFLIAMMIKIDKLVKFVGELTIIEDGIFGDDKINIDEEKVLKSIMEDLKNDIEDKREDFIRYHKMINSDQVGES
tara:strand:+ start:2841 stop:3131 length:291 start_codon:yes stop_codon:yes gene_type:complete